MQRLLIQLAIASITFATGVTANIVFNSATRSLPDEDFPIVDLANGELHWTSPVLIRPFENHCGMLIVRINYREVLDLGTKISNVGAYPVVLAADQLIH